MTHTPDARETDLPQLPPELVAIDSHCHLHDAAFASDRDTVWQRARAAGVEVLVEIGASDGIAGNHRARELAERYEGVFFTPGIHPHDAKELDATALATLDVLARHPRAVAIGETGLDYHYDHSPREHQRAAFRDCIALARQRGLPLTIHLREAEQDALEILRAERANDVGGVIHCFTSDWDTAKQLLDLGFYLSFSGVVTFKNADTVRHVATRVPRDRFLIETDAPHLAPVPRRGRRNEPAFVLYTAACLAALRHARLEDIVRQATENTITVFSRLPTMR